MKSFLDPTQLDRLLRAQREIAKQVREGSLPYDSIMSLYENLITGRIKLSSEVVDSLPEPEAATPAVHQPRPSKTVWDVDGDVNPSVIGEEVIIEHEPMGQMRFCMADLRLFVTEDTRKRYHMANANMLDFLLARQELIPKRWREYCPLFPGTTYRGYRGHSMTRGPYRSYCKYMRYELGKGWVVCVREADDGYDVALDAIVYLPSRCLRPSR